MRQVVLIVVVIALCGLGLAGPEMAVLSYVWFSLLRPDALAYSTLPFSMLLAVVALLSSLRYIGRATNLLQSWIAGLLILQQFPVALSVVFAVNTALCVEPYNRYIRIVIMALLIPVVIDSETWLRRLMILMPCSMGVIALKFGVFSMVFGGAGLVKGYTGLIGDSNGLSLAMATVLGLCLYGRDLTPRFWLKCLLLVMAVFSVVTVVMAGSRGNMLAVGCVLLLVIFRSKYKLLGAVGVVLLTMPALYLAGDRFSNRMATISDYEEDASAAGRLDFWKAALKMSKDYPVFGVGYGEKNYITLASKYLKRENHWVVHNTYLQTLVDCGVIEFVLYTATLWGAILWLGFSVRRMRKLKPEWVAYPLALQTSLVGFAAGSTFYSRGDFEFMYIVCMTAASWQLIERRELRLMEEKALGIQPAAALPELSTAAATQAAPQAAPQSPPRLRGGRPVPLRDNPASPYAG